MIKSVIWSSMLDYPDNICTTIFFDTCNFDCEYCYNKEIKDKESIDFYEQVLPKLNKRKVFIKNIILSGGECTLDKISQQVLDCLFDNGFTIGIHTNGSNIDFIKRNIDKISFIGMDIKTSFEKYNQITRVEVNTQIIKQSIKYIIDSKVDYEFRTTIYPKYVEEKDCINIAKYLKSEDVKLYVLQQYKDMDDLKVTPYNEELLLNIVNKCNEYLNTKLRGI